MAKLLAEESNRHWEDGINVLKKHLQIGGLVDNTFLNYFTFSGKGELEGVYIPQNYRNTMLNLMKTSRAMVNTLTDYHYVAVQNTALPPYGDLDVAHFLSELAEKEAEIAYKMTTGYLIHESIASSGLALDIFDENL
ncbi:hypothetical protein Pmani_025087 [Petrolisthes manimaculis]|uniref:Ferritin n=1 Tax=Petrolisthes manimaculis TaxID=1843537 RepID=A0AAE1P8N8_9EUCA|nr:hypothetical protein Pmani_025087 [Petrolisthes manimaculis]